MSRKKGLSLRVKILILMTLLPLGILAAYLFLAIRVFQDDKIAYVFETSSSIVRSLAAQSSSELEISFAAARPLLRDYLTNGKFSEAGKALLERESRVDWAAVFTEAGEPFVLEKRQGRQRNDWSSMKEPGLFLSKSRRLGRAVAFPFGDDRVLLGERILTEGGAEHGIFVVLGRSPALAQAFQSPGQVSTALVRRDGDILFGPRDGSLEPVFRQKLESFSGTREVSGGAGKRLLVSAAATRFPDVFVVSSVEKDAALSAVRTLVRKSLLFFGALICLTVLVSLAASKALTSSLSELSRAARAVGEGHFDVHLPVRSGDEVGELSQSFNQMAAEVKRLMDETADKVRMENELKTAQTVQSTLFPEPQGELFGLRIGGFYEPASECGGDWWHYGAIGDKVYLWLGDATGHGVPAALITSAVKAVASVIEDLGASPEQAMALLNNAVYEVSRGKLMMTFFLACYDPSSRSLIYCNASHEAPFLIRKSDSAPTKKDLMPLNEATGPRLGQERNARYETAMVPLNPGDRILIYTDGIPDVRNPAGEAWGERAFLKSFVKANEDYPSASEVVKRLVQDFQDYRQDSGLVDDVTLTVIEPA